MTFKIKFTKLGNQFFFISNLTEWHFSCEREYNKIWLEKTGPLNKKEKIALKQFGKILKKYGFKKKKDKVTWLGAPFVLSSQKTVWKNVKSWVSETEYKEIKTIFKLFQDRFDKIWAEEKLKLKKTKMFLARELTSEKVRVSLRDLSSFFHQKPALKKAINIFLFAIPKQSPSIGGSAILEKKGITLEIRDLKSTQDYILVMIHEIGHNFLKENFINEIQKTVKKFKFPPNKLIKEKGKVDLIGELIICSFIPSGYLAKKYFNIPIKKSFFSDNDKWKFLEKCVIFHIYPVAKEYIENKKRLDKNYIKTLTEITIQCLRKSK